MDGEVILDDVLGAISTVLQFLPAGSLVTRGLGLAFGAVTELRSANATMNPEELRAELAKRLGSDVAEILTERFG